MTAKEYLQQVGRAKVRIQSKVKQLEELRCIAQSVGGMDYSKDRVQASEGGGMSKAVVNIVGLEEEIKGEIEDYTRLKNKIINDICKLPKVEHTQLLLYRYVDGMRFEEIAFRMNYTYQYARELHGVALIEFEDMREKETVR